MKFKRKLSEALYIKELSPSLNKQEASVTLKRFNCDGFGAFSDVWDVVFENTVHGYKKLTFFAESSILDIRLALNRSLY